MSNQEPNPSTPENENENPATPPEEQKSAPFVDTGSLGEFLKKVTDKLIPSSQAATRQLENPEQEPPVPPAAQPASQKPAVPPAPQSAPQKPADPPTTRKLYPFDQNVPFPGSKPETPEVKPDPRAYPDGSPHTTDNSGPRLPAGSGESRTSTGRIGPRPATGSFGPRPAGGGSSPLTPRNPKVTTNPLNKLAQQIEAQGGQVGAKPSQRLGTGQFGKGRSKTDELRTPKNPFVDDDQDLEPREETLAMKIKNGSVPPETLRLLITSSMSDAEVLAICSELNIDWDLVPGETREERTQYLVEYFGKHDTHLDYKEVATTLWSQFPEEDQQDWGESDARLKELQETLTGTETGPAVEVAEEAEEKELSFFGHLREDFSQASTLQKVLVIGLSLVVLILVLAIGIFALLPKGLPTAPSARATPEPLLIPSPRALEFPGGWTFPLKPGVVQDGAWQPQGSEWLQGTEICRLISVPWNKQLDAVYSTFQKDDVLQLTMTNEELLRYRVTELKTTSLIDFNQADLNEVANSSSPCLVVVLTRDGKETRQMIVAVPVLQSPIQQAVTVTPQVTDTPNPAFPTVTLPAPTATTKP